MCEKAILDVRPDNEWNLEVLDEGPDNEWHICPTNHVITSRFAEVIQRYSCDAYVNSYRKDIKITIAGLVSLYNEYWKDE